MIYKFRKFGYSVDYLVDFSVTTDLKNSRYLLGGGNKEDGMYPT